MSYRIYFGISSGDAETSSAGHYFFYKKLTVFCSIKSDDKPDVLDAFSDALDTYSDALASIKLSKASEKIAIFY